MEDISKLGNKEEFLYQDKSKRDNDLSILKDVLISQDSANNLFGSKWLKDVDNKSIKQMLNALNWLLKNGELSEEEKLGILNKSPYIVYKKYISPADFLTPNVVLPASELDNIYPHIKQQFLNIFNPLDRKHFVIDYMATRMGKTVKMILAIMYTIILNATLRDNFGFYKFSESTQMTIALLSYTEKKVKRNVLNVLEKYLNCSPLFTQIRYYEKMRRLEDQYKQSSKFDTIYYTTAKQATDFYFLNNLDLIVGSSMSTFLGQSILFGGMTELTFAVDDNSRWSDEYVVELLGTLRTRINGSFVKNKEHTLLYFDSSPNVLTNEIDRRCWNNEYVKKNKDCIEFKGARYEICPEWYTEYPEHTFKVFVGNGEMPPKILEKGEEKEYPIDKVHDVPLSLKSEFEENLSRNIKDVMGIPLCQESNLITNYSIIEDMFNTNLKNIYTSITAPTNFTNIHHIFDTIKKDLFIPSMFGSYNFYYKPELPRVIGIDQSFSKDPTGISVVHKELNTNGDIIYVVDFTICIIPDKTYGISLTLIEQFIKDLRKIGGMNIVGVVFDSFQSRLQIEKLADEGFKVFKNSVDRSVNPYLNLIDLLTKRQIKCGKNLFFKNNLKSIYMKETGKSKNNNIVYRKIDHRDDKEAVIYSNDLNWGSSTLGLYAKDVSDSVANSIDILNNDFNMLEVNTIFTEDELTNKQNKDSDESLRKVINSKVNPFINCVKNQGVPFLHNFKF